MARDRSYADQLSEFLKYLAQSHQSDSQQIPSLADLSHELGVGVASLREQLEVARALGLVEVKPRTGIRCLPYSFRPAAETSLAYALAVDANHYQHYSDLRYHIETSYWFEAASRLTATDYAQMRALVQSAKEKLGLPVPQIPHQEHRELHLLIYQRLENPFVSGLLEAYWNLYEAAGLDVYTDIAYLQQVWLYHEKMVEAICMGNLEGGYNIMIEHIGLLAQRNKPPVLRQKFE